MGLFAQQRHTEPVRLVEVDQFEVFQVPSISGNRISRRAAVGVLSKKIHRLVGTPYADFSPPANSDTFYLLTVSLLPLCYGTQAVYVHVTIVVVNIRDFERQSNFDSKSTRKLILKPFLTPVSGSLLSEKFRCRF